MKPCPCEVPLFPVDIESMVNIVTCLLPQLLVALILRYLLLESLDLRLSLLHLPLLLDEKGHVVPCLLHYLLDLLVVHTVHPSLLDAIVEGMHHVELIFAFSSTLLPVFFEILSPVIYSEFVPIVFVLGLLILCIIKAALMMTLALAKGPLNVALTLAFVAIVFIIVVIVIFKLVLYERLLLISTAPASVAAPEALFRHLLLASSPAASAVATASPAGATTPDWLPAIALATKSRITLVVSTGILHAAIVMSSGSFARRRILATSASTTSPGASPATTATSCGFCWLLQRGEFDSNWLCFFFMRRGWWCRC
jgi:hypothetical protein